jgi:hypothetical protein
LKNKGAAMGLRVYRTERANIDRSELARELGIGARPTERQGLELRPLAGSGEPAWLKFDGRLAVKSKAHNIEGSGAFIVTRRRLIAGLNGGIKTSQLGSFQKGAAIFFAVEHDDLDEARLVKAPGGGLRRVELPAADGSFVVRVLSARNLHNVVKAFSAEELATLDDAGASQIQRRKAEKLERDAAAEAEGEANKARAAAERFAAARGVGAASGALHFAGALLDHRRTWRYRVAAPADACVGAFIDAFSAGGGLLVRAKWATERTSDGAVAVYGGRKGVIAAATMLSARASAEQDGALGSKVQFAIESTEQHLTFCAMWLAAHGSRVGFTNDGRFFRPYMRSVEDHLRMVDPGLLLIKE